MAEKIQGMLKLQRKLRKLEKFQTLMIPPTNKGLALMHDDIGKTPRKAQGAFSRLATPAQKRAYWARVRSGEINHREGVGYVRSNALQQGWKQTVKRVSNGVTGVLSNPVKYGQYVQGRIQQAFHRASGWRQQSKVIKDNRDKVMDFYRDVVRRELNR